MSAVEIVIVVTLPLLTATVLVTARMLVAEREARHYDRKIMSMLRDHLLKARDVLVGMEARGVSPDPGLDVFRPSESDWLASADSLPPDS